MSAVTAPEGVAAIEVAPLGADEAREITDQIKSIVGVAWELICTAYQGRAWVALGHDSWDAYCAAEFDGARLAMPREDRREVVASLRDAGLSSRAIAAATGVPDRTIRRDLAGGPNVPPADAGGVNDMDVMAKLRDAAAKEAAKKITGTDGKSYPDKSRAAVDQRVGKARAMAKEGYTSRQIAKAIGVGVDNFGSFRTRHNIVVPADATVGSHIRRLDHDRIVTEGTHSLEGIVMGLDLVTDTAALDPNQIEAWVASLSRSITDLTRFNKRLKETIQ